MCACLWLCAPLLLPPWSLQHTSPNGPNWGRRDWESPTLESNIECSPVLSALRKTTFAVVGAAAGPGCILPSGTLQAGVPLVCFKQPRLRLVVSGMCELDCCVCSSQHPPESVLHELGGICCLAWLFMWVLFQSVTHEGMGLGCREFSGYRYTLFFWRVWSDSRHLQDGPQPSAALVLWYHVSSSSFPRHQAYMWCTYKHLGKTLRHKK